MYKIITFIVLILKKIIPEYFVDALRPFYHRAISLIMAASYGFPARKLTVIGVTGTKGKSTVAEMLFTIFSESGHKTALASTIRFAIGDMSEPNLFKMTLQGRGFIYSFMNKALRAGCTHIIVEITSESVLQFRHWFLEMDGLIVTNIQREHIERHGSFENYVASKREIVKALEKSPKKNRILVSNEDIKETQDFLSAKVDNSVGFSKKEITNVFSNEESVSFVYNKTNLTIPIAGKFNAMNALSAIKLSEKLGIKTEAILSALNKLPVILGRVEHINAGQDFVVIVDYAHTPDSLKAIYSAFTQQRKICVLGNTGGGRDVWKRPEMGKIADENCDEIILTNEDPYDEDPQSIIDDMLKGMNREPVIILDRRNAIKKALTLANTGDVVLITGKGTDPFIMEADGKKTPWSDALVAREELTTTV